MIKNKYKYLIFTVSYGLTIFLIIFLGDKFFTAGTEPGPSLFKFYADRVFMGELPYRDFLFEYPPFTLPFILIPRIFSAEFFNYQLFFWLELAIFGLLGLWMIIDLANEQKTRREAIFTPIIYCILLFILGVLNFSRYDLIPAILTLGAVWLKIKNKNSWAYFILGLGVMTKIYPIVILPLFIIEDHRSLKVLFKNLSLFLLGIILPLIPFILHLNNLKTFIAYQGDRGIQLESIWANFLMIQHLISKNVLNIISEAGALGLFPYPKYFIGLSYYLMAVFLTFIYWLYSFKNRNLVLFSFLTILSFIIFNRVFSPQYFAWILVFAPLLYSETIVHVIVTSLMTVGALFTRLIYPYYYTEKGLLGLEFNSIMLLSARNFVLLAILIILLASESYQIRKQLA